MSNTDQSTGAPVQDSPIPRRGRWGLYLPLILLGLVVAGWSVFWVVARQLVTGGLDRVVAEAAQRGDVWTCVDRSVGGYPFRIEVRCRDVTLARTTTAGMVQASLGPLLAIGQPHTPNHVIFQGDGPARARLADGRQIEMRWELAEASRRGRGADLERLSLDLRKPVLNLSGGSAAPLTLSAQQLEAHVRKSPTRPESEGVRDVFLKLGALASGDLDALFGDANPSDLDLQLAVGQGRLLAEGATPAVLEAWRLAGGRIEVTRFAFRKGIKQVEARGDFGLDAERRPSGRLEPSIANIDQFAGIRLRGGAMDLASALSGRAQPTSPDGLRPMPAIELREGRVVFGPIRLPLPPLTPLY